MTPNIGTDEELDEMRDVGFHLVYCFFAYASILTQCVGRVSNNLLSRFFAKNLQSFLCSFHDLTDIPSSSNAETCTRRILKASVRSFECDTGMQIKKNVTKNEIIITYGITTQLVLLPELRLINTLQRCAFESVAPEVTPGIP